MSPTVASIASSLGWVGALGTVGAYALVSQQILSATSRTFQAVNGLAAAMLTISALAHDSWPSAVANLVWVLIAVSSLVRSVRAARSSARVESRGYVETDAVAVVDNAAEERTPVSV